MSTSFVERNNTLFWNVPNNFSMADIKMKKACNINGPVSLVELGRSYCGFQKMDVLVNPRLNHPSDVVVTEYVNAPGQLSPFPGVGNPVNPDDPFGEECSTVYQPWQHTWVSANANMFMTRKDPNSVERLTWKFRTEWIPNVTPSMGFVVVTYPKRDQANGTVVHNEVLSSSSDDKSIDVDLPANGHVHVTFSIQVTCPALSSVTPSTKCGRRIHSWQVKYR